MIHFTLIRGEWRRGNDRVSPNTVRTLHARGVCRLWVPVTPETADIGLWGAKATAREWHRLKFGDPLMEPQYVEWDFGRILRVPTAGWRPGDPTAFRLWPCVPNREVMRAQKWTVIGAARRSNTPSGWCWEVRPRVGAPTIVEERGGVEVARYEVTARAAIHERIGKDLAAIDPAAWEPAP